VLPWNLLKNSNRFASFLSAYSVFLSSIAGVMVRLPSIDPSFLPQAPDADRATGVFQIIEYFFVRKDHYRISDLYSPRSDGWYRTTTPSA
jgi:nucleobase:cation symporter-1, NCS1 family